MMKRLFLIVAAVLVSGCVYTHKYPEEWGERWVGDLTGMYSNQGRRTSPDGQYYPFPVELHRLLWHKPSFEADAIRITQKGNLIELVALANQRPVAEKTETLSAGNVKEETRFVAGALEKVTCRYWRTRDGLVIEWDSSSIALFTFLFPLAASDKSWSFFKSLPVP